MIEALLAGVIAGYAIAIPVGAISVLIIHTGMSDGLGRGLAAGAGAATADGIYAALAVLAGLGVSALIAPIEAPLRVVGGIALAAIAVRRLLILRTPAGTLPNRSSTRRPHSRTYATLLGLTLLNPATIVYFAALAVGLPFLAGVPERLVFAGAAFVASLSWQSVLALFGATIGRRSGNRLRLPTVLLGNGVVLIMGTLITIDGARSVL
jgi:arginine exporter protein ArgO